LPEIGGSWRYLRWCAVAFGSIAFIWPGIALGALVLRYGAFALFDGVLSYARLQLPTCSCQTAVISGF
jgi:uncharacterized membrane protein HdeD (DUF308 family)